LDNKVTV